MPNAKDVDFDRGGLAGDYARDPHRGGLSDDYARDGGWSGGGKADQYTREERETEHEHPAIEDVPIGKASE
jgi:hypothetical protein